MNTTSEIHIQERYDSLRDYWIGVVGAIHSIGIDHTMVNSPGVIIGGKGEKFGNLRFPVKVNGLVVAEIISERDSAPAEFIFNFTDTCPDWLRAAITNPDSNPLDY